ncbi:hypothetical protein PENTCL1PPCAC_7665, partial [Pristionchus entomophagus]
CAEWREQKPDTTSLIDPDESSTKIILARADETSTFTLSGGLSRYRILPQMMHESVRRRASPQYVLPHRLVPSPFYILISVQVRIVISTVSAPTLSTPSTIRRMD